MTILAIKYWQQTYHSKHTSFFKSSHQCNKGHQLLPPTKQDQLRTQTLPLPFQIRLTFSFANIAHNYQEQNLNSQHTALFESAKIKLSSSNKIHNCTTKSLPPDAISLFNKGTNFIPTTATTSISSLQETVTSKVNTARRTIPPESNHQTPQRHFAVSILTTNSFIHFLYHINNNQDLITSTFTSLTMLTTLFHSLKNFYNLLNNILLFILIYLTSTHTPHLTTMTLYLQ